MTPERVIGIENALPWKLPADMKWFRQHTLGKPVVMGRKTYESFGARPLPERHNIVVSRDKNYAAGAATVAYSIDDAIKKAIEQNPDVDEIMIIGGASFYEQTLPIADRMYLTEVHTRLNGDAWFPEFDETQWQVSETHTHEVDEKNSYAMSFNIFSRVTR
ncbi:Dihydrofolate reductase [hydrothermal vent metagenome]|uniref:dihydrofolate reductase n=1 Tax=hydrothermal vent metagenome TaxID=652676 RepID=A0A3B1A276_9ZZZZ